MTKPSLRDAAFDRIQQQPALPHPGSGQTLDRWRALAGIAAQDVALVKVLEAHYDALSILAELRVAPAPSALYAVWAAEPPQWALSFDGERQCGTVSGSKGWCSGANLVTHALVTARRGDERVLVALDLAESGHTDPATVWPAVGMSRIVSAPLHFTQMPATLVASEGRYLSRPGFWHGGAGIAACWFGAATAIAEILRTHPRLTSNPHAAAHLGAVHFQLLACRALLRELAARIDTQPHLSHQGLVTATRCAVERMCTDVIDRVGRALGPAPLCEDEAHAQRCADLSVFIRQCHAEREWQQLGEAVHGQENAWTL